MAAVELHVQTTTGGDVVYDFAEQPVVTFVEDDMVVQTKSVTVHYPVAELKAFAFTVNDVDAIESVTSSEPDADSSVSIYNMSGMLVKKVDAVDNKSSYSLEQLPAGTYIVKSNLRTYKVIKK